MSQTGAGPDEPPAEPSMEDILASIRRILNDESETAAPPAAGAPEPPADDVFQLEHSMIVEEPAEPAASPPPEEPHPPEFELGPQPEEPLLAPAAAAAASASMGALVRVVAQRQAQVYGGGPTLEDMVRDELRPILKTWLDENLAPLVERAVRAEIERVTRNAI
jgi:cell pole-organizing protein PopZ